MYKYPVMTIITPRLWKLERRDQISKQGKMKEEEISAARTMEEKRRRKWKIWSYRRREIELGLKFGFEVGAAGGSWLKKKKNEKKNNVPEMRGGRINKIVI